MTYNSNSDAKKKIVIETITPRVNNSGKAKNGYNIIGAIKATSAGYHNRRRLNVSTGMSNKPT